ncbi:MAG: LysR substrate-binding domain-containing protein [Gammaproteobacteria bacterium]|nr:LysR substrate-binding domain-containing protein [Gammaproteobacteria bacterium]MDH3411949.1 LysR substrate-binding domain-containing protein [Gammaproteobacteria bacterium]
MNSAQLRAFHAVASRGSFTTAARALNVTQPTLSSQVKALEQSYGIRLFDRVGRGVILTELGSRLHEVTQRLYNLEEEADEILSAARELSTGSIRVGSDGPHHVIPIVAEFKRRHPDLDISLDMGNADRVLKDLRESRIDVAVLAQADDDPRLYVLPFRTSRLVLFVPRAHPLSKRKSVRIGDVAKERMILRETQSLTRKIFESALNASGIRPKSVMQIESREAVREAVAAGLGVGVVSESEFDSDRRLKTLPFSDVRLEITEYVVCLEDRRRLRIVQAFLEVAEKLAPGGVAER